MGRLQAPVHSKYTTSALTVLSALVFEPRPALWAGLVFG
ncbi:hypothetical protein VC87395_000222 [Vibrio paracholerae 87395]|nr:hypothetical protein VC87395_000222 [Vibrio paracholerae 87395]